MKLKIGKFALTTPRINSIADVIDRFLVNNEKNEASYLIANSLKMLPKPKIVVSYADTAHNHSGVVYQATNFLFTGTTKGRTDQASANGKHSRHSLGDRQNRVYRSPKHRYVIFVCSKKQKKIYMKALKYAIKHYPKAYSVLNERVL